MGALAFCFLALVAACGSDDEDDEKKQNPDQPFGATAIVVVVNPEVNTANASPVPTELGTDRNDIAVDAQPGGAATTDATGLAVIEDQLDAGDLSLEFGGGPTLPFTIVSDGDVYDLAVGYSGTEVAAFENFPIRYPVGGDILEFNESSDPADVTDALATDNNIVFFKNGSFNGDLTIAGDSVIFFAEGFTERQVVIEGSVEVKGTGVRVRGFDIKGDVTVAGNEFGMAFTIVRGTTSITGNGAAFLRNTFCGSVNVPSSNASLLDNEGVEPIAAPTAVCNP
jgi:hypothetical protein